MSLMYCVRRARRNMTASEVSMRALRQLETLFQSFQAMRLYGLDRMADILSPVIGVYDVQSSVS